MKNSLKLLVAALALGASVVVAQGQTAIKLALVDIAKIYDGHYSLPEQQEKVKAYNQKAQEEFDRLLKEGQGLAEKFKELEEQAQSPLLKDDARQKIVKEAETLAGEIQKKEGEVQEFRQNANAQIGQAISTFRNGLVEQITKVAIEVAKKKGATVVIDKSSVSSAGFPIVMYADASFEITDEVLAEVNKGKPVSVAKPAAAAPAAAAPAAPAAPAGDSAAPAVSFPGTKK